MNTPDKVSISEKLSQFDDKWSPKIVGDLDDYHIKLVKIEGDFVWHSHEHEDEMFLVLDGAMDMDFRDQRVTLEQGEFIVVPKGIEHKPHAAFPCSIMLLERAGVVNTGDAPESGLTAGTGERL